MTAPRMRLAPGYDHAVTRHHNIKLVCFDLGGVLIRICRSWEEGCRAAGIDVPTIADRPLDGEGWYAPQAITNLYQCGRITCEEFARRVADAFQGCFTPQQVMRVHEAWMYGEYQGVGDVIDSIHASGLKTAALSNTNQAHWRQIEAFPSVMRLHYRLASHELGLHKPDAAIYQQLEQRTGHTGREILFFDDLRENVQAARALGWIAEQVDPLAPTDRQISAALRRYGISPPAHSSG